jgi:hypothetical protein
VRLVRVTDDALRDLLRVSLNLARLKTPRSTSR